MAITTAGWTTNKSIAETYAASLTGGAWSNHGEPRGLLITTPAEAYMGRGILLWLLGIPIPIIILILLFWH